MATVATEQSYAGPYYFTHLVCIRKHPVLHLKSHHFSPPHPQHRPHDTSLQVGPYTVSLYKAKGSKVPGGPLVELDFLFIKRAPTTATNDIQPRIELLNLNNVRFSTICFPLSELLKPVESFQIHLHNRVAIQYGIAKRKDWDNNPNQKMDEQQGFGVGDNSFSWGFDPILGQAWHNKEVFAYGTPCEVGDGIRCIVDRTAGTISFQRWPRDGSKPIDFGVAFKVDPKELLEVIPAVSLARFQCIQFDTTSDCTKHLFSFPPARFNNVATSLKIELIHILCDHVDEDHTYSKEDDTLHMACVLQHDKAIAKIKKELSVQSLATLLLRPIGMMKCGYTPVHMCVVARQSELFSEFVDLIEKQEQLAKLAGCVTKGMYNLLHVTAIYGEFSCMMKLILLDEFESLINAPRPNEAAREQKKAPPPGEVPPPDSPTSSSADWSTPLDEALRNGHVLCAELLICFGGTIKSWSAKALYKNRFDSVLCLMKHRDEFGDMLDKLQPDDPFVQHLLASYETDFRTKHTRMFYAKDSKDRTANTAKFPVHIKFGSINEVLYTVAIANKLWAVAEIQCFKPVNSETKIYPHKNAVEELLKCGGEEIEFEVELRLFDEMLGKAKFKRLYQALCRKGELTNPISDPN